jgi:UDP-N-acetyl-D-glucosamine dehydrogenase
MVGKVWEAMKGGRNAVNGARVLVLGVAYKPNIDDVRESPAIEIMKELEKDGAEVIYHDPHVPTVSEEGRVWTGVPLTPDLVRSADAVLIVTDHAALDLGMVLRDARVLVDSRNAMTRVGAAGLVGSPRWIVKRVEG